MAKLYTLELGFVPFKSQTDLTDLYLGKRLAGFDRVIEIDAAKVRTYDNSCNTNIRAVLLGAGGVKILWES